MTDITCPYYDTYILILRVPENDVDSLRCVFSDGAHEIKQIGFDGIPHHVSIDQIRGQIRSDQSFRLGITIKIEETQNTIGQSN